jgi:hypothetical protein
LGEIKNAWHLPEWLQSDILQMDAGTSSKLSRFGVLPTSDELALGKDKFTPQNSKNRISAFWRFWKVVIVPGNVRCCAGFWTPASRGAPLASAAGVQKAPRHEVAGRFGAIQAASAMGI